MPKVTLTEARVRALRPGKTVRDIPAIRSANLGNLLPKVNIQDNITIYLV